VRHSLRIPAAKLGKIGQIWQTLDCFRFVYPIFSNNPTGPTLEQELVSLVRYLISTISISTRPKSKFWTGVWTWWNFQNQSNFVRVIKIFLFLVIFYLRCKGTPKCFGPEGVKYKSWNLAFLISGGPGVPKCSVCGGCAFFIKNLFHLFNSNCVGGQIRAFLSTKYLWALFCSLSFLGKIYKIYAKFCYKSFWTKSKLLFRFQILNSYWFFTVLLHRILFYLFRVD